MKLRQLYESEQITLKNGRIYQIVDTGKPYENGNGGIIINAKLSNGEWGYIDNFRDMETVKKFFNMMERR